MTILLGVDLGTSADKAVAITTAGAVLARGRAAVAYRRPAPDRVQFSAEERYQRLTRLLRDVVTQLPRGAKPAALSLSGANGNLLLLDAGHRPLAPAISWLDTRAGEAFESLLPGMTREEVRATVGWPWTKRFPLTQLAWLRRYRAHLYRKARYYVPDTAYYHYRLTGRLAIDHSSATPFFLQDQRRRCWHEPYLRALGVAGNSLPDLVAAGTPVGALTAAAARECGLAAGVTVVAGSFDHPSAALGSGVWEVGDLLLSGGTSWVGFFPLADRATALAAKLLVDPFRQPDGPWGAMFALTAIGTAIDRYLTGVFPLPKSLSLAERYRRFSVAAGTVRSGEEGPPIDPMAAAPANAAEATGLCAGHSLGQLSRRLMVGTALAVRRRMAGIQVEGFKPRRIIMVGGPATSTVWTQIVADVLGRELHIAGAAHAGAIGAAALAGVGVGCFRDTAEAVAQLQPKLTSITPDPANGGRYDRFA